MGIGIATGDKKATQAAQAAISSPMLEIPIDGAKKVLFSVTGGASLTLSEVNEAANLIMSAADPDADVFWGQAIDEDLRDAIRITVIATGFGPGKNRETPKGQPSAIRPQQHSGSASTINLEPVFGRDTRTDTRTDNAAFRSVTEMSTRNADLPSFLQKKDEADD